MSKKHWGPGGSGKITAENCGDMSSSYEEAGHMKGLKRALKIVSESADRSASYKRLRLLIRHDGWERRR
jgi:hypothetical protein